MTSGGTAHGRFLLVSTSSVRRPDLERRLVAVTLADQAAAALDAVRALSRSVDDRGDEGPAGARGA